MWTFETGCGIWCRRHYPQVGQGFCGNIPEYRRRYNSTINSPLGFVDNYGDYQFGMLCRDKPGKNRGILIRSVTLRRFVHYLSRSSLACHRVTLGRRIYPCTAFLSYQASS